ncbi:MAG: carboxylesterase/lipase family protein, partial [Kutzneria sp.]|nr:carboxylesterase/lipase family protein [Kutzneria sp.]
TPGPAGGPRPVMVWLHGGGFSSGAGSAEWYAGDRIADRGDLVVVNVNYRLGVLGYVYLAGLADDMGEGNLGLLDMIAALRWVRENIAAFGGDPDQVTVAGQSGGALSTVAMMANPESSGLFRRVILQSAPLELRPDSPEAATEVARLFLRALDLRPAQVHRLREIPVGQLLGAQLSVARATARPLTLAPPFQLVADGRVVCADPAGQVGAGGATGIEALIGWNRDEASAFLIGDEHLAAMTRQDVVDAARSWLGDVGEGEHLAGGPVALACHLVNARLFGTNGQLAAGRAAAGNTVYTYRFDWRPEGSPFGACHCLELPFVFGNPSAWRDAPMLPRSGECVPASLVDKVQSAWISFARSGDPHHAGVPHWAALPAREQPVGNTDAVKRLTP